MESENFWVLQREDIRTELGIPSLIKGLEKNKEQWNPYSERLADERLPKEVTQYKPHSKRDIVWPLKRWSHWKLLKPEQMFYYLIQEWGRRSKMENNKK